MSSNAISCEEALVARLNQDELQELKAAEALLFATRKLEWLSIRCVVVKLQQLREVCRRHNINWRWYCDNHLDFMSRRTISRRLEIGKYLPTIEREYGERLNARDISITEVMKEIKNRAEVFDAAHELYERFAEEARNRERTIADDDVEVGDAEEKKLVLVDEHKIVALVAEGE